MRRWPVAVRGGFDQRLAISVAMARSLPNESGRRTKGATSTFLRPATRHRNRRSTEAAVGSTNRPQGP
jgi:hypothetical protein